MESKPEHLPLHRHRGLALRPRHVLSLCVVSLERTLYYVYRHDIYIDSLLVESEPEHLALHRHRGLALRPARVVHGLDEVVLPRARAVGLGHAEENVVIQPAGACGSDTYEVLSVRRVSVWLL